MNPLFRATAATLAIVRLSDISSSSVVATDHHQQRRQQQQQQQQEKYVHDTNWHRRNDEFGIGTKNDFDFDEDFVPPWRDEPPSIPDISAATTTAPSVSPVASPVASPTAPPTAPPTVPPTSPPTAPWITTASPSLPTAPLITTASPSRSPLAIQISIPDTALPIDDAIDSDSDDEDFVAIETSCTLLPSIGNFVTEVLDIEYFLYLNEEGIVDEDDIQDIVDSSIEPRLHEALVALGMGCNNEDFVAAKHVMVQLSSSGSDLIGGQCSIDSTSNDGLMANATACYQVWGQIEATMWFAPRRRRQLQGLTTPFGDREAFNEFAEWMEEAFDSLEGTDLETEDGAEVLKASFQGFANINEFDGSNLELAQGLGVDQTAAFMGTALSVDDNGMNMVFGLIAIVAGVIVLAIVVVVVAVRRKRNRGAFLEHARCVDELALESKDDLDDNADVVDDESLFRDDNPLPEGFKVKLESADHDYRWIGEDRKNPIFVATERNKEFRDHLEVLKRKKEQEVRARQYQSVML